MAPVKCFECENFSYGGSDVYAGLCYVLGYKKLAPDVREDESMCGIEGKWFERKE